MRKIIKMITVIMRAAILAELSEEQQEKGGFVFFNNSFEVLRILVHTKTG